MHQINAVYIVANQNRSVLYTGVTGNLERRAWQHAMGIACHYSTRYNTSSLVYYEIHSNIETAIEREKFIKGKSRRYKYDLIKEMNPEMLDLRDRL